jgi:hypothetical protein
MTTFNVAIEDGKGKHVRTFHNVPAQTKREAINKVKSMLVFTAERVTIDVENNNEDL